MFAIAMTLKCQLSSFFDKKICELECTNRNQQVEIEKLRKKNAILHLRLAEALISSQNNSNLCSACSSRLSNSSFDQNQLKEKLLQAQKQLETFKSDLMNLSSDVKLMINSILQSHESLGWIVTEKVKCINERSNDIKNLNSKILNLEEKLKSAQDLHRKEKERRKELHNTLVQVRGNIRVQCRVRPILEFDYDRTLSDEVVVAKSDSHLDEVTSACSMNSYAEQIVYALDDEVVSVLSSPEKPVRHFEFERVYSTKDDQQHVFDEVQPLLTSFLDGYNVCIMAYGQTGSGKSYTMLGNDNQPGIVPRAAKALFHLTKEKAIGSIAFSVSVAEVYNNDIFDLLADDPKREKHGIVTSGEGSKDVPTITHIKVANTADILSLIKLGLNRRARISTKVHEHSSRSHLVVSIVATFQHQTDGVSPQGSHSEPNTPRKMHSSSSTSVAMTEMHGSSVNGSKKKIRRQLPQPNLPSFIQHGSEGFSSISVPSSPICVPVMQTFKTKLQFVDLAGSECVGMSGVTGAALRESSYINRSLSALADVLGALSENRSHIPYRNSRLTHLLQDSIGGDAKMLILLCVSPTRRYAAETLQCLGFGSRTRKVQRGQTKRKGHVIHNRCESPAKVVSPRQSRANVTSAVRRIFN